MRASKEARRVCIDLCAIDAAHPQPQQIQLCWMTMIISRKEQAYLLVNKMSMLVQKLRHNNCPV